MPLPRPFTSHHTVWVHCPHCAPRAVRYAVAGDRLVVFGDGPLAAVPDGTQVRATVHDIAGGPPLAEVGATAVAVPGDDVEAGALLELLEHVPLGRTPGEVEGALAGHRRRRVLTLVP